MLTTESEKDQAIRQYAAGTTTLATLQQNGIENYLDVLGRLGDMGLRPPTAPLKGQNADMRERGRTMIADRIRDT